MIHSGTVSEIELFADVWNRVFPGNKAADGRKVKGTIHWVDCKSGVEAEVRIYDRLFTEKNPMKDGAENFLKYLNPDSLKTVRAYIEPALAGAKAGERFQFERTGYFIADEYDHTSDRPVFNRTVTLKDSYRVTQ